MVIVVFFLTVQLALPVARMFDGSAGMQRFGWQMFSRAAEATVFTVVTGEGETNVRPDDVLARARGDLDLERLIPPFLCETVDGAVRVVWDGGEHRC